jgi:hypothetical protein
VTRDSVEQAVAKKLRRAKGRPVKGDKKGAGGTFSKGTNSSEYLAARLERDHPKLVAEVKAGRMKLRDAAREAEEKVAEAA